MTYFEKLYIHLLTYAVERYGGKEGIKHIEELLEMDHETLIINLHNSFEQAKRANHIKDKIGDITNDNFINGIDTRNFDNDSLDIILNESISITDLKRIVLKQINKQR